jgi:alanine dehydrogenase
MCATNSIEPVLFARWIVPGMHLSAIKLPEIEGAAIARADRLVIHTHDAKPLHVAAKELAVPETSEGRGWAAGRGIDFDLGLGYQFAAAGAVVYRNAMQRGLGRDLPTEWLTQDVHP